MNTLTIASRYASVKKLLALAFAAALVINFLLSVSLVFAFGQHKETIFNWYGGLIMIIIGFCLWFAFQEKRSLFWPYLAINMNASAVVVGVLLIIFFPLNWAIILLLMVTTIIMLGLNVGNLKDPQAPPPKAQYVIYQFLSAASVGLSYWLLLPK